jgi:hypothetical protein
MNRGRELTRVFASCDQNLNINVGKAELERRREKARQKEQNILGTGSVSDLSAIVNCRVCEFAAE